MPEGKYGSIAMSSNADAYFLDVYKETEKAVYFQYFGKLHWLPKSAFVLDKKVSDEVTSYFKLKPFFQKQLLDKY